MSVSSCKSPAEITTVSASAFQQEIAAPQAQVLDVRDSSEFSEGHIDGAANINVASPQFLNEAKKMLRKDKPVYVYCRGGRRSMEAAKELANDGYNVVNLDGGIIGWEAEGKPVVK